MLGPSIIEQPANKDSNLSHPTQYIKGKLLGKGGFAEVYETTNISTKDIHACKIIDKQSVLKGRTRQKLMNEIKIHKSLDHKNIVKFFSYFEDESFIYIILEICTCESLSAVLRRRKRLMELEVQSYMKQILEGLKYLHSLKIIHRDIKLGNILLNQRMEVKIADFGLSTKLEYEGERKRTICGTPNYMAPEILSSDSGHSYEVDIWSIGIMIYTMLVGKPPFQSSEAKVTYSKIKQGFYSFPSNINFSDSAKDLISRIIVSNPSERLTLDQVASHDFFTKSKIPRLLPYSTLAMPLSESYLKAFERKPNTPREILKHREKFVQSIRSNSQISTQKLDFNELKTRTEQFDFKEISESLQTATCTASSSCINMKKIRISSNYDLRENGPEVWVQSWVDYSNKYGLAYKLSNGCIGILFNDTSKLISNFKTSIFRFIPNEKVSNEIIEFSVKDVPSQLVKNVKLAIYFRKYFSIDTFTCQDEISQVFVNYWKPTHDAVMFRINNKVTQVYFRDQTELFFNGSKYAAYVDKHREITVSTVLNVLDSGDKEFIKRMKITKEILVEKLKDN